MRGRAVGAAPVRIGPGGACGRAGIVAAGSAAPGVTGGGGCDIPMVA